MIEITLPYPISTNAFMGTRVVKAKAPPHRMMAISYLTHEAVAYVDKVKFELFKHGIRAPMLGRVCVDIKLYPARPQDYQKRQRLDPLCWDDTVRRLDLDNARKVLYDSLKDVAFADDFYIFKDSGEVMEPDGREACVVVTITPYVRPPKPAEETPQVSLI